MSTADHAKRLASLRRRRERLDEQQRQLTEDLRIAITDAHDAGMSGSEIAKHLGMSRQAVNRLYLP
jgi:IS30 family transposase